MIREFGVTRYHANKVLNDLNLHEASLLVEGYVSES